MNTTTTMLSHQLDELEQEEIQRLIKLACDYNLYDKLPELIQNTKEVFEDHRNEFRKRGIMI